jgi:hypothetical protein
MVQVHHDEEVANRIGPGSCAAAREGIGEALTGDRTGQPLSRESTLLPGEPAMQVQIRSHIARYLRDSPQSGEGVITLGGVEHCFMYIVQDDVVELS